MMPNKTYELRKLYFEQSQYSVKPAKPDYPLLLQWPTKGYFERLRPDADLLQKALKPDKTIEERSVSEQIFGNEIKQQSGPREGSLIIPQSSKFPEITAIS